jgi:DNA modification methylase
MTPYYEEDGITIYCGDCREILPSLQPDVVITDPPYGCSATTGWGGAYDGFSIEGDDTTELRDWLVASLRCPAAIFGSARIPRPASKAVLIWAKGEHTGMGDLKFPWKPDFEEIYIIGDGWSGNRTSSVIFINARTDSSRYHPTEKPEGLMVKLVMKAPPGLVVDPFMGSGTTLVAAKALNRRAIGIELNEDYCKVAVSRLRQRALPMFGDLSA